MPLINVVHGDRIPTSAFNVRVPVVRPAWGLLLMWWAVKTLAKLLAFLVRYWWATAPLFAALYVWGRFGTVALAAVLATVVAGLVSWWRWHRASFRRFAALPYVSRWRHVAIYKRRWHAVMAASGLAMSFDGDRYVPRLLKVKATPIGDELTIQMLPGQVHEDWAKAAPRLAPTFRVRDGRARSGSKPDRIVLLLRRTDPLTQIVAPFPVPMVPDLTGLPVGRREDDRVYRLKLAGTHVLIAGETGAGKGSVIWSIVSALAGGIAAGTVKVIGLDPKGGMELAPGARLFSEFAYGDPESMATVLEEIVAKMQARSGRLRGVTRQHTPTVDEPLYVVVIDEIAAMTSYGSDRKTKDRIKDALSMLLTQGRALGVHVIAALQDPRKEILPVRDLFPTRIALQLTEPEQVDLVLNEGALDRGARCHEITLPGVGYVIVAKQPWPVQVRFSHFDDAAIGDLATKYGRLRPVPDGARSDYEGAA